MVLWSSFHILSEARMPECSTFGNAKMGPRIQLLPAWCLCHSVPFSPALMARSLISFGLQKSGFFKSTLFSALICCASSVKNGFPLVGSKILFIQEGRTNVSFFTFIFCLQNNEVVP